jgi:kynurenine formamidase
MARLIEVSHEIEAGMTTYPGLPGPVVSDFLSREASRANYAAGTTFQIGRIEMVVNTGTYVDAPFHRLENGMDVAGLPLERLADVEGVVADAARSLSGGERAIGPEAFVGLELSNRAVLVRTGWSAHFGTPRYADGYPYLSRDGAQALLAAGPALVGIDSLNIDDNRDGTRPVHTMLLTAGIPIVEHLRNLEKLPREGFRFHCVPAPFRGVGSFPVRAYAVLD